MLEDSLLNEGPRDRSYHRSGWGAVFGSSLLLFAIAGESKGANQSGSTKYEWWVPAAVTDSLWKIILGSKSRKPYISDSIPI